MATEPIGSFDDLLRFLEGNPEHRARLRQLILDEEFQQLPAQVRALAERLDALTGLVRLLSDNVSLLNVQMRRVVQRLDRHERHLSRLMGDEVERRFQRNAPAYFAHLLRRIRVVDPSALADEIDDAIDAGILTHGDRRSLMAVDLVVRGLDREFRAETRLAVEVSSGIGERDIMRAKVRSELLEKLTGLPSRPVVGGYRISSKFADLAADNEVHVTIIDEPDTGEPEPDEEDAAG